MQAHCLGDRGAVDDHGLAFEHRPVDRPVEGIGHRRKVHPHAVLVGVEDAPQARRLVAPRDHHVAGGKDFAQLVADEVDDGLEVKLGADALLDAVDDRQLGVARFGFLEQTLRLVEEAGVLEGRAHAAGQRLEKAHVAVGKRMFVRKIGQRQHADRLVGYQQRHHHLRLRPSGRVGQDGRTVGRRHRLEILVDQQGSARAQHLGTEAVRGAGRHALAHAIVADVGKMQQASGAVVDADADGRFREDLAKAIADRVVDVLEVELAGERVLHGVDDTELGHALPFRLEAPRVLQGEAQARGDRRDQLDGSVVEGMGRPLSDHDHTHRLVVDHERHVGKRLVGLVAADLGARNADALTQSLELGRRAEDQRLAGSKRVTGDRVVGRERARRHLEALATVDEKRNREQATLAVEQVDAQGVGLEDLEHLVADEIDHRLQVELGG